MAAVFADFQLGEIPRGFLTAAVVVYWLYIQDVAIREKRTLFHVENTKNIVSFLYRMSSASLGTFGGYLL